MSARRLTDDEIRALIPEHWTYFLRQEGVELEKCVETYNDVAHHLDLLHEVEIDKAWSAGTLQRDQFPPRPTDIAGTFFTWMAKHRIAIMDNPENGCGWAFWIASDWGQIDPATPGNPAALRPLKVSDVRACVHGMTDAVYADYVQRESNRAKH